MVEGRGQFEWSRTANMMALQINMNLPKGKKRVSPMDFNPFVRKKKKQEKLMLNAEQSMNFLENFFCKKAK